MRTIWSAPNKNTMRSLTVAHHGKQYRQVFAHPGSQILDIKEGLKNGIFHDDANLIACERLAKIRPTIRKQLKETWPGSSAKFQLLGKNSTMYDLVPYSRKADRKFDLCLFDSCSILSPNYLTWLHYNQPAMADETRMSLVVMASMRARPVNLNGKQVKYSDFVAPSIEAAGDKMWDFVLDQVEKLKMTDTSNIPTIEDEIKPRHRNTLWALAMLYSVLDEFELELTDAHNYRDTVPMMMLQFNAKRQVKKFKGFSKLVPALKQFTNPASLNKGFYEQLQGESDVVSNSDGGIDVGDDRVRNANGPAISISIRRGSFMGGSLAYDASMGALI